MKLSLAIVCLLAVVLWIYLLVKVPQNFTKSRPNSLSHYETFVPYSNITKLSENMQRGSLKTRFNSTSRKEILRFNSSGYPETVWKIPKILHFIWVGPLIKEKYVATINNFSQDNPNYKVGLKPITCV